jgi:hypothetical protein
MLQCMSLLLAHSGRAGGPQPRQLLGVKRTPTVRTVASAFDPKRTFPASICCSAQAPPDMPKLHMRRAIVTLAYSHPLKDSRGSF